MISLDEDALICDLAETYGIYDYRSLPVSQVATFSVGLRDNSRIKSKIRGETISTDTLLLGMIYDNISKVLVALGAIEEINTYITDILLGKEKKEKKKKYKSFDTPASFEEERRRIIGEIQNGRNKSR